MPDNKHYLRRVVPEHRLPKLMKWLEVILSSLNYSTDIMLKLDSVFDIDFAIGRQLNVDGSIVGRERLLNFEPSDGSSPLLDDDTYRMLQKAKISMNQWDGTIPGVIVLWENLFPEYRLVIEDNQDMTMNLYIIGRVTQLEKELLAKGYLAPKPEGVRINYEFNFEEDYEGQLYVGTGFSMASHYIMYDRLDTEYQFNSRLGVGGGYSSHKEYVMK